MKYALSQNVHLKDLFQRNWILQSLLYGIALIFISCQAPPISITKDPFVEVPLGPKPPGQNTLQSELGGDHTTLQNNLSWIIESSSISDWVYDSYQSIQNQSLETVHMPHPNTCKKVYILNSPSKVKEYFETQKSQTQAEGPLVDCYFLAQDTELAPLVNASWKEGSFFGLGHTLILTENSQSFLLDDPQLNTEFFDLFLISAPSSRIVPKTSSKHTTYKNTDLFHNVYLVNTDGSDDLSTLSFNKDHLVHIVYRNPTETTPSTFLSRSFLYEEDHPQWNSVVPLEELSPYYLKAFLHKEPTIATAGEQLSDGQDFYLLPPDTEWNLETPTLPSLLGLQADETSTPVQMHGKLDHSDVQTLITLLKAWKEHLPQGIDLKSFTLENIDLSNQADRLLQGLELENLYLNYVKPSQLSMPTIESTHVTKRYIVLLGEWQNVLSLGVPTDLHENGLYKTDLKFLALGDLDSSHLDFSKVPQGTKLYGLGFYLDFPLKHPADTYGFPHQLPPKDTLDLYNVSLLLDPDYNTPIIFNVRDLIDTQGTMYTESHIKERIWAFDLTGSSKTPLSQRITLDMEDTVDNDTRMLFWLKREAQFYDSLPRPSSNTYVIPFPTGVLDDSTPYLHFIPARVSSIQYDVGEGDIQNRQNVSYILFERGPHNPPLTVHYPVYNRQGSSYSGQNHAFYGSGQIIEFKHDFSNRGKYVGKGRRRDQCYASPLISRSHGLDLCYASPLISRSHGLDLRFTLFSYDTYHNLFLWHGLLGVYKDLIVHILGDLDSSNVTRYDKEGQDVALGSNSLLFVEEGPYSQVQNALNFQTLPLENYQSLLNCKPLYLLAKTNAYPQDFLPIETASNLPTPAHKNGCTVLLQNIEQPSTALVNTPILYARGHWINLHAHVSLFRPLLREDEPLILDLSHVAIFDAHITADNPTAISCLAPSHSVYLTDNTLDEQQFWVSILYEGCSIIKTLPYVLPFSSR